MAVDRIKAKDKIATGEGPPGKRGALIWLILAVAAAMRVLYLIDFRAHSVFWDAMMLDADIYDKWAQRIVAGDWLGGREVFTLPPLYPYFLAILYKLFGHAYGTVYVLQSLMGLANIYMIHSIGRKVFRPTAALVAPAMAVLYGSFMFMESKLMSTTLALTMGLGLLRLLLLAGERQTLMLWGACGALLGFTALVRPETLVFVPFAMWWIHRVASRSGMMTPAKLNQYTPTGHPPWSPLSVFAAFAILAVSPVAMRNWVLTNDWSLSNLISSEAGITFYQSNNERAAGLSVLLSHVGFTGIPEKQAEEEKVLAEKETGHSMKRSEVTRYWMNKGWAWIFSHPARFLVLEYKKLRRFLGSYEYSTEYLIYVERESVPTLWLGGLPFAAIASLGLAEMLMQGRRGFRPPALLLAFFVASNFLVVMMFYFSSRYRMPSVPYLILFAAAGVERLAGGLASRISADRTVAAVDLATVVALFLFLHIQMDDSHKIQEATVHYNVGNRYAGKNRYEEALTEYDRALRVDRANWRAWFNRGSTLNALGRKQEAIESFRQVLEFNKNMPAALQQLKQLGATP